MNHKKVFIGRVDTHRLKDQVVVVEPADEKLKAELEKEVGQGPGFADKHFSLTLYFQVARHGGTVEQNVRPGITTIYVHTGMTLKGRLVAQRGQVGIFVSPVTSKGILRLDAVSG